MLQTTMFRAAAKGEIDQPHAIRRSCQVETELSDSGTKETFLPNLRIEIPEGNLDVMTQGVEGSSQPQTRSQIGAFPHSSCGRYCSLLEFCTLVPFTAFPVWW